MHRRSSQPSCSRAGGGIALLGAVAACAAPDPFDLAPTPSGTQSVFEGTHVSLWSEPELPLCTGTPEYLDNFVGAYLKESEDGDLAHRVSYFYLEPETLAPPELCGSASACTRSGHVYAANPTHTHELVHAIRDLQEGAQRNADFFEEGLAQLHYDHSLGWDPNFAIADIPDHVRRNTPAQLYDRSAHLLSFLAIESSWSAMEHFVDSAGAIRDHAALDELLVATTNEGLDSTEDEYTAYPKCSLLAFSRLAAECDADPIAWQEADWAQTPYIIEGGGDFGCSSPDAVGPRRGRVWKNYTVDVPASGDYRLELDARDGMTIEVVSCGLGCGEDPDFVSADPNLEITLSLARGRHVLRASRKLEEPGPIGFVLKGPL